MLKFTKTDHDLEINGATAKYDDGESGILKLKIARSDGNPHYDATLARLMAPYRKKMERGKNIDNATAKRVMTQVYAKEILLGWDPQDLIDEDGNPTPYTEENAIELLTNDNDLRDFVVDFSGDQSNFLRKKK